VKTDSLFYKLFQKFPHSFFELIGQSSSEVEAYQFTSVEIKQPNFTIDGLFKPSDEDNDKPIYFIEVQFQKKDYFYWRFFAEVFLYLKQEMPTQDWQAVAVFKNRNVDPGLPRQYRGLLMSQQVKIIYLEELEKTGDRSLALGMVQLIVEPEETAGAEARQLIGKARQLDDEDLSRDVVEFIETVIVYKFANLSRQEIQEMLELGDLKQTRFYQEAKVEGKLEGKLETVPVLLRLGLSVEQTAGELGLDIELVRQAVQGFSGGEIEEGEDRGN
jgi:predicted transposase/invertase (TIGR01784 family)